MKMLEIIRFEIGYKLRRPSTWFFFATFIIVAYLVSASMLAGEAERAGDLHANGPAGIAVGNVLISMIGLLVCAALFSDSALRDVETRMQPLFAAAPITKIDYLGGRFAGALIVNALLITVVPFCLMLFTRVPFVNPELLGPFSIASYVRPYVFFLLPNLFSIGAVLFAIAVLTRRSLPVFAAGALLFLGGLVIEEVLSDQMGYGVLATILEPFGFSAMSERWEFWTPFERNTRQIYFEGALVWNRIFWFAAGALTLFSLRGFGVPGLRGSAGSARSPELDVPQQLRAPVVAEPVFDETTRIRQVVAIVAQSFRDLVFSRDFLLISIGLAVMVVLMGTSMIGDNFGVPFWPLTQFVAPFLGSFLPETAIALLVAFYAGELVWRERDAGLNEISDANPVLDWALFLGKFGALALMLVALQAVLTASGLLLQVLGGYFRFEPGLYLTIVFGLQLADYLLLAALAVAVHVLVDNKYFGHLLVVLCYLVRVFASRLGIDHNLIVYGDDPGWVYSDISGFGPFLGPALWFKLYWAGWAVLLAVVASLFWIRGRDRGWGKRLRLAGQRFKRTAAAIVTFAAVLIVSACSWILYNTNVLAGFRTRDEAANFTAEYERRYGKYENAAQPHVTATKLHVEIYPALREVAVRGTYALKNATQQPIDTLHLFLNPEVENRAVVLSIPSSIAIDDAEHGHRTYKLARALAPAQSMEMRFDVRFKPRGFPNSKINTSVVENGTYFDHTGGRHPNHRRWLPVVGYQTGRELKDARARREAGLPPRPLAPSVDDLAGEHVSTGREPIHFEAVIGTTPDQIAIAPGSLRRSWSEKGRRYFHYVAEKPIKNVFAIFSADYRLYEETWKGVPIQIFHHPTHAFNVKRFARAAQVSIDYYTTNFGPYPFKEVRIAAFPKYASLAYAYPGTISYAETMGWVTRVDETQHVDQASLLVAHEVAHQWWGHQVTPATASGAGTVTEVLSQYCALMVAEKIYGPEMIRRYLWNTRIEYLNRRGRPEHAEVPLLFVTEHPNLVYRKGPLAMYALRQYIGEDRINAALRRLVEKHGSGQPRYATSLDLYRELKAATPPSLHYLLEDFLEHITLWNLRATRVTAKPSVSGTWQVTLDVQANKLRADGTGKESEVAMNDLVEIGVFDAAEKPLYLARHRVRSGGSRITVSVSGKPATAGIDPRLYLIDRNWSDNMRAVR